ncbi:MAG TPA: hypothetical protein VMF60_04500 [Acidimicrobiales bacterium]|nr:hypothetical protein [Acidimicrobiales bacterium]
MTITCKKLSGNITGTVTAKTCKKVPKGYKSFSGDSSALATGGTLTWNNGDTVDVGAPTTTDEGQGRCKKNWEEEDSTGTVTGSGGDTFDNSLVGGTYSSDTCIGPTGQITLVKKTVATF